MRQERSTRQKRALAEVLRQADEFRTAREIHDALRGAGEGIGLTTVYTQLRALSEAGAVDALRREDGETLYRLCDSDGHHHHLRCRDCGRTVEVEHPDLERWADELASAHGFAEPSHTLEIVGICAACAAP
ncbi:MAG: Fur family transcriptional regulator [Acidimicrobiales bacterium]